MERAQTDSLRTIGVAGRYTPLIMVSRIALESAAEEGNSPVDEN